MVQLPEVAGGAGPLLHGTGGQVWAKPRGPYVCEVWGYQKRPDTATCEGIICACMGMCYTDISLRICVATVSRKRYPVPTPDTRGKGPARGGRGAPSRTI